MSPYDTLGKHSRLTATWRGEHQMTAPRSLYDLLLFCVKCHHHIAKVTLFWHIDKRFS